MKHNFCISFKVTGFSTKEDHDRLPPHRQNRLCGAKSSSEVVFASPDFIDVTPNPSQDTKPNFNVVQNLMLPMVYIAIDTSYPSNSSNIEQSVRILYLQIISLRDNLLSFKSNAFSH